MNLTVRGNMAFPNLDLNQLRMKRQALTKRPTAVSQHRRQISTLYSPDNSDLAYLEEKTKLDPRELYRPKKQTQASQLKENSNSVVQQGATGFHKKIQKDKNKTLYFNSGVTTTNKTAQSGQSGFRNRQKLDLSTINTSIVEQQKGFQAVKSKKLSLTKQMFDKQNLESKNQQNAQKTAIYSPQGIQINQKLQLINKVDDYKNVQNTARTNLEHDDIEPLILSEVFPNQLAGSQIQPGNPGTAREKAIPNKMVQLFRDDLPPNKPTYYRQQKQQLNKQTASQHSKITYLFQPTETDQSSRVKILGPFDLTKLREQMLLNSTTKQENQTAYKQQLYSGRADDKQYDSQIQPPESPKPTKFQTNLDVVGLMNDPDMGQDSSQIYTNPFEQKRQSEHIIKKQIFDEIQVVNQENLDQQKQSQNDQIQEKDDKTSALIPQELAIKTVQDANIMHISRVKQAQDKNNKSMNSIGTQKTVSRDVTTKNEDLAEFGVEMTQIGPKSTKKDTNTKQPKPIEPRADSIQIPLMEEYTAKENILDTKSQNKSIKQDDIDNIKPCEVENKPQKSFLSDYLNEDNAILILQEDLNGKQGDFNLLETVEERRDEGIMTQQSKIRAIQMKHNLQPVSQTRQIQHRDRLRSQEDLVTQMIIKQSEISDRRQDFFDRSQGGYNKTSQDFYRPSLAERIQLQKRGDLKSNQRKMAPKSSSSSEAGKSSISYKKSVNSQIVSGRNQLSKNSETPLNLQIKNRKTSISESKQSQKREISKRQESRNLLTTGVTCVQIKNQFRNFQKPPIEPKSPQFAQTQQDFRHVSSKNLVNVPLDATAKFGRPNEIKNAQNDKMIRIQRKKLAVQTQPDGSTFIQNLTDSEGSLEERQTLYDWQEDGHNNNNSSGLVVNAAVNFVDENLSSHIFRNSNRKRKKIQQANYSSSSRNWTNNQARTTNVSFRDYRSNQPPDMQSTQKTKQVFGIRNGTLKQMKQRGPGKIVKTSPGLANLILNQATVDQSSLSQLSETNGNNPFSRNLLQLVGTQKETQINLPCLDHNKRKRQNLSQNVRQKGQKMMAPPKSRITLRLQNNSDLGQSNQKFTETLNRSTIFQRRKFGDKRDFQNQSPEYSRLSNAKGFCQPNILLQNSHVEVKDIYRKQLMQYNYAIEKGLIQKSQIPDRKTYQEYLNEKSSEAIDQNKQEPNEFVQKNSITINLDDTTLLQQSNGVQKLQFKEQADEVNIKNSNDSLECRKLAVDSVIYKRQSHHSPPRSNHNASFTSGSASNFSSSRGVNYQTYMNRDGELIEIPSNIKNKQIPFLGQNVLHQPALLQKSSINKLSQSFDSSIEMAQDPKNASFTVQQIKLNQMPVSVKNSSQSKRNLNFQNSKRKNMQTASDDSQDSLKKIGKDLVQPWHIHDETTPINGNKNHVVLEIEENESVESSNFERKQQDVNKKQKQSNVLRTSTQRQSFNKKGHQMLKSKVQNQLKYQKNSKGSLRQSDKMFKVRLDSQVVFQEGNSPKFRIINSKNEESMDLPHSMQHSPSPIKEKCDSPNQLTRVQPENMVNFVLKKLQNGENRVQKSITQELDIPLVLPQIETENFANTLIESFCEPNQNLQSLESSPISLQIQNTSLQQTNNSPEQREPFDPELRQMTAKFSKKLEEMRQSSLNQSNHINLSSQNSAAYSRNQWKNNSASENQDHVQGLIDHKQRLSRKMKKQSKLIQLGTSVKGGKDYKEVRMSQKDNVFDELEKLARKAPKGQHFDKLLDQKYIQDARVYSYF